MTTTLKATIVTVIAAIFVLVGCGKKEELQPVLGGTASPTPTVQAPPPPEPLKEHKVLKGQFLRWIADQHNVSWEAMLLKNEGFLQAKYSEVCKKYREQVKKAGNSLFCNDRYNRPYGNTLLPGWKLAVPSATAPAHIGSVVASLKGDTVALVIDDTGSMNNDRAEVAGFYLAALRQHQKKVVGVWLYADGKVRKYEAGGVKFLVNGNLENTFGALREAAASKPDTIVLVSDEPGDDWDWSQVSKLPPVVAHCLAEQGRAMCASNLQRLATATKGRYEGGLN